MNEIYLINITDKLRSDKGFLSKFKIESFSIETEYLPLCRWKHPELPRNVKVEIGKKRIKSWGKFKEIRYSKLVSNEQVLYHHWRYNFVPSEFIVKNNMLFFSLPQNMFGAWYFGKNNKIYHQVLPRNIEVDDLLLESLGLMQGEMITSTKGKSKEYLSFTNSDPNLVMKVIELLKRFCIRVEDLSAQIILNIKGINEEQNMIESSINFWSKSLNLSRSCFTKVYCNKNYRTSTKFGSVSIKYRNRFFRLLFQGILHVLKENLKKHLAVPYMRGVLAAEGNINLSITNSLNFISVGVKRSKERNHYIKCFKTIGIKPGNIFKGVSASRAALRGWKKGTGGYFVIQGWDNFKVAFQKNLLNLKVDKHLSFLFGLVHHNRAKKGKIYHKIVNEFNLFKNRYPEKFEKLIEKRNKITRREMEVLNFFKHRETIQAIDIARTLKIKTSSASRILSSLYRKGRISRVKNGVRVFWKLKNS